MFLNLFKARKSQISLRRPDISEFTGELFVGEPRIKLLNNGEISSLLCDSGASFLMNSDNFILSRPYDLLRRAKGVFCYITCNGNLFCTTLAPLYQQNVEYETAFSKTGVTYFATIDELKVITQVRLYQSAPCEQREILLSNRTGGEIKIGISFVLEPYYYENNPAEVLWDKDSNALTVGYDEDNFGSYLGVGFYENTPFLIETKNNQIAMQFDLVLQKGESRPLHLLMAHAQTRFKAISLIHALRSIATASCTGFSAQDQQKSLNPISQICHRIIQTLLPQILYAKRDSGTHLDAAFVNELPLMELNKINLSKDIPIVVVDIYSQKDKERISSYIESFIELNRCFILFDLVFLYEGNSETKRNIVAVISDFSQNIQLDKSCGIHIISKENTKQKMLDLIYAAACHIATRSLVRIEIPQPKYIPIECIPALSNEKYASIILKLSDKYYNINIGSSKNGEIQVSCEYEEIEQDVFRINLKLQNPTDEEKAFSLCYVKEILADSEKLHSNMVQGEILDDNKILLLVDYTKDSNIYFCLRIDNINIAQSSHFCCDRPAIFSGNWNSTSLPPLYDTCAGVITNGKLQPHYFTCFSLTMATGNSKDEALSSLCRNYVIDKSHKN